MIVHLADVYFCVYFVWLFIWQMRSDVFSTDPLNLCLLITILLQICLSTTIPWICFTVDPILQLLSSSSTMMIVNYCIWWKLSNMTNCYFCSCQHGISWWCWITWINTSAKVSCLPGLASPPLNWDLKSRFSSQQQQQNVRQQNFWKFQFDPSDQHIS